MQTQVPELLRYIFGLCELYKDMANLSVFSIAKLPFQGARIQWQLLPGRCLRATIKVRLSAQRNALVICKIDSIRPKRAI